MDPTSLDRLNDIVVPDAISWWPPAPIWYAVMSLLLIGLSVATWMAYRHWKANRYRHAALQSLASATTISEISALLKRTALVFASRTEIACLTQDEWPVWLDQHTAQPMQETIRLALSTEAYAPSASSDELESVRHFAADWIRSHHVTLQTTASNE